VKGCPFEIPSDPAALRGPPPTRPVDLPDWSWANLSGLKHSHPGHFSPVNFSADGWSTAIFASQFRRDCRRLLLVEDDMNRSGLGFSGKIWSIALLVAVRDNRVLLEVPGHRNMSRWCNQEPYSLQCTYEPWTQCPYPAPDIRQFVPGGRPMATAGYWRREQVVRTSLGRIHRQGKFWFHARSSPFTAASRLLFRPRAWVRAIGDCVMRAAGLGRATPFISLHIRHSVEKDAESMRNRFHMPSLETYHRLARALSQSVRTQSFFIQTSSAIALSQFSAFAHTHNFNLHFTDNPRSEHDMWGGWIPSSNLTLQTAIGAVNAHISAHAAVIASPGSSVWTDFLFHSTRAHRAVNASNHFLASILQTRMTVVRCPPSVGRSAWFGVFGPRVHLVKPALMRAGCQVAKD